MYVCPLEHLEQKRSFRNFGTCLNKGNNHKYLDLTFASDVSWNLHIDDTTSVALHKLYVLRRCLSLALKHT